MVINSITTALKEQTDPVLRVCWWFLLPAPPSSRVSSPLLGVEVALDRIVCGLWRDAVIETDAAGTQ